MACAVIVSEYNPFHNGHLYQIGELKRILGSDTPVVAVMSGNFTERGELAVTDKYRRAKATVLSGVDLVLELPFPYSASGAEFFAKAGVFVAQSLGLENPVLVFGAETPDEELLGKVAAFSSSDAFWESVRKKSRSAPNLGFPQIAELTLREAFDLPENFFSPNNTLAVSYLSALQKSEEKMNFLPLPRVGAGYHDAYAEGAQIQSAAAIRAFLQDNPGGVPTGLTEASAAALKEAQAAGELFPDGEKLFPLLRDKLLNKAPAEEDLTPDAKGGLYTRLAKRAAEATGISDLIGRTETKKFTKARIRRAILHTIFGVTSSDILCPPAYTTVLAMNETGAALLGSVRRKAKIKLLTKPSAKLDGAACAQKALADRADIAYALCFERPVSSAEIYRKGPAVCKKRLIFALSSHRRVLSKPFTPGLSSAMMVAEEGQAPSFFQYLRKENLMLKNEGVKGSYLEYKGRPLVRQNNEIWYGDLSEEYHTYMMIMGEKTVDGEKVPDKIMIQLMKKGEKAPEKQSIGNGLADALDTANAWLERKNK